MKFKLNDEVWEITKIQTKSMMEKYYEMNSEKTSFVFGLCDYRYHKIYINADTCFDQQLATLKHELTHAWIFTHGVYFSDINEEVVCDIVSRSNTLINEVVKKFKSTYGKGV